MTEPASPPRNDRIWLYVALAFLLFWGFYLRFFAPGPVGDEPQLEGTALGVPADYSWMLTDLDGAPVAFSRFKGRPVFLNIWATWCGPCVGEMPTIAALAARPDLKDVAFVCVATDDTIRPVKEFVQGKSWPMTVLHATEVPRPFRTDGIPATFLIAPDGAVAASQIGSAKWDDPSVAAFLAKLRDASAKPR